MGASAGGTILVTSMLDEPTLRSNKKEIHIWAKEKGACEVKIKEIGDNFFKDFSEIKDPETLQSLMKFFKKKPEENESAEDTCVAANLLKRKLYAKQLSKEKDSWTISILDK